jgi:hypothetical protein
MDYQSSLSEHLSMYPSVGLQDIYKYFHQAYFGPGHAINDPDQVLKMLKMELENLSELDPHPLVPLGKPAFFYRVNLSLIRTGQIQLNELAEAFLKSAKDSHPAKPGDWLAEWDKIQKLALISFSDKGEFRLQQIELLEKLKRGERVFSHSETFRRLYHPHYRVIGIIQIQRSWQHILEKFGS